MLRSQEPFSSLFRPPVLKIIQKLTLKPISLKYIIILSSQYAYRSFSCRLTCTNFIKHIRISSISLYVLPTSILCIWLLWMYWVVATIYEEPQAWKKAKLVITFMANHHCFIHWNVKLFYISLNGKMLIIPKDNDKFYHFKLPISV